MADLLTTFERRALGVLTFVAGVVPVAIILAMILPALIRLELPEWFFTLAFVAFIIIAGLNFPLYLILGEVVRERLSPQDRTFPTPNLRHPLSLFEFWWRYVREPPSERKSLEPSSDNR